MLKVGLTGGLASGKTFAANEFQRLGCAILQADRVGHEVLADDAEARRLIIEAFGPQVANPSGAIDRQALAGIVFKDKARLERLNAIVHPRVFERIDQFFATIEDAGSGAVAIVEAAIMIESGSYVRYDRLVLAACSTETQIHRYMEREGTGRDQAEARIARQMPLDEKRRYADFVIDTNGSEADTTRQVREVFGKLRTAASQAASTRIP